MPLYEYECKSCGKVREQFSTVSKMARSLTCSCGGFMGKIISNRSKPIVMDYYDETLGARVTGPRQQKQLMRNHPLQLEFK